MSFADAQPALSTGAVDGQENPLSVFVNAKMWTLNQKFLSLWGYTADPLIFVVNREVWMSWTPLTATRCGRPQCRRVPRTSRPRARASPAATTKS